MWLFLLTVLGTYGAAQAYVWWALSRGWHLTGWLRWALLGWCAAMIPLVWVVHYVEGRGWHTAADILAVPAYVWMAATFWFLCFFVVTDLWNAGAWIVGRAVPAAKAVRFPAPWRGLTATVLVVATCTWSYIEARRYVVREVVVEVPRLPADRDQVRIAMLSDVHLGLHLGPDRLERILAIVRDLQPDLILSAGDLVDGADGRIGPMSRQLRELQAPLGKYAIFGNHEFYAGPDASAAFHDAADLELLRGEAVKILDGLWLVGVDDTTGRGRRWSAKVDEMPPLRQVPEDAFTILLKHRPLVDENAAEIFDLQLSGHTHGGQIWPWHFITETQFPHARGRHRLSTGAVLYTSVGTGTWGPSMRLFARPEVTLIRLVRPEN